MFSKFERSVFSFVRGFFLLFAFIGFVLFVFSAVALTINLPKIFKQESAVSIKLTHEEVENRVQSKNLVQYDNQNINENKSLDKGTLNTVEQSSHQKHTERIMQKLDKKFEGEVQYFYGREQIKKEIESALSKIPEQDLESFVNEMLASIKKAPKEKVFDYIVTYFNLYFEKYNQETSRILSEKQNAQEKAYIYFGVISSSILLLISAGIILILAAIERNTRQEQKHSG